MAQNEMRAKPALPERVRSMEGLGAWCWKHSEELRMNGTKEYIAAEMPSDILVVVVAD